MVGKGRVMTTAVIVGGVVLLALGLVASQLFRLRDWLNRQPPVPPAEHPDTEEPRRPPPP